MTTTTVLLAALTVAVAACFVLILALAREIGRIQVRLGPVGARTTDAGPPLGATAPVIAGLRDQHGRLRVLGGPADRDTLVMFTSPRCVACKALLPGLRTIARTERDLDVVLVADGEPADHEAFLAQQQLGRHLPYVVSAEAGMRYRAGVTPYGVLLDRSGAVAAKGLCNHIQQVESLLNARDTGFATLQELSDALDHDTADLAIDHGTAPTAPTAPTTENGGR